MSDDKAQKKPCQECCECITTCPGKCCHATWHKDDAGQGWICFMTPLQLCQVTTFLVCLWLFSILFFYIMFVLTDSFKLDALYGYLIAFILFTLLFVVLIATDKGEEGDFSTGATACKPKHFRAHIESQWKDGMTWDNFGIEWHLEHMIALKDPNAGSQQPDERVQMACQRLHYTNSVPQWDATYHAKSEGTMEEKKKEVGVVVHHDS